MDICQGPPEPLLQAGKPQLSQSLLKCQVLQLLHHPHSSSLDSPVYLGFSCTGEPRTRPRTSVVTSPVLSRGEGSPLSTC